MRRNVVGWGGEGKMAFGEGEERCKSGPNNATSCRAGPVCPAGSAVRNRRADRGVRPYGSVTGGAMGGRPQGSPLRKRYKGCKGRADRGVRPYGSVTGGAMGGRPQGSPLRSAARNVWAGYRPLRKFFDREGMVCFGFWWRRMTRAPGC